MLVKVCVKVIAVDQSVNTNVNYSFCSFLFLCGHLHDIFYYFVLVNRRA